MSLFSILYSSAAAYPMQDQELIELLEQSRSYNQAHGVTGMLLYHNESFMQYLEGARSEVLDLYDRIAIDDRHTGVTLYFEREIEERNFADWSMGFTNLEKVDSSELEGFTPFLEKGFTSEAAAEQPTMAMRLLLKFRDFEY
jgi:hypothetical protein